MKYRFIVITEDYGVYGMNNIEEAKNVAEDFMVVDVVTGAMLSSSATDPTQDRILPDWEDMGKGGEQVFP